MSKYITRTAIEKEHTLAVLKDRFRSEMNNENLLALLAVLKDSVVLVPGRLVFSEEDAAALTASAVGDILRNSDEVRFVPDYFTTGEGEKYCPMFSDEEHIPEDYKKQFSFISMTSAECLRRAHKAEGAAGIVLDPLKEPVSLMFETADVMEKIPSRLSPTQQKEDGRHPVKNMQITLAEPEKPEKNGDYFKGPVS